MADWIITLPQECKWETYQLELDAVKTGLVEMNYRTPFKPSAKAGDRCFICWRGQVVGWMAVTGVTALPYGFTCTTTGVQWPPGYYITRSGPWHPVDGPDMKGFRGIRRYKSPE